MWGGVEWGGLGWGEVVSCGLGWVGVGWGGVGWGGVGQAGVKRVPQNPLASQPSLAVRKWPRPSLVPAPSDLARACCILASPPLAPRSARRLSRRAPPWSRPTATATRPWTRPTLHRRAAPALDLRHLLVRVFKERGRPVASCRRTQYPNQLQAWASIPSAATPASFQAAPSLTLSSPTPPRPAHAQHPIPPPSPPPQAAPVVSYLEEKVGPASAERALRKYTNYRRVQLGRPWVGGRAWGVRGGGGRP